MTTLSTTDIDTALKPFFTPWEGANYEKYRVAILSESVYDWIENDEWVTPPRDHAVASVKRSIAGENHAQYFKRMTRAICGSEQPDQLEREEAWNKVAHTIYVPRTIGKSARSRPSAALWKEARDLFPRQFSGLSLPPKKLIITGKVMWKLMPDTAVELQPNLQAYKFNGGLLWCLALPHPRNSTEGFKWKKVASAINVFVSTEFPDR